MCHQQQEDANSQNGHINPDSQSDSGHLIDFTQRHEEDETRRRRSVYTISVLFFVCTVHVYGTDIVWGTCDYKISTDLQ